MGTLRPATDKERRRYGVVKRMVGSRWYKSSHSACVYEKPKPYRLDHTFAAIRSQQLRELGRPSTYPLMGDGERTRQARDKAARLSHQMTEDRVALSLIEARYHDWLETRGKEQAEALRQLQIMVIWAALAEATGSIPIPNANDNAPTPAVIMAEPHRRQRRRSDHFAIGLQRLMRTPIRIPTPLEVSLDRYMRATSWRAFASLK